MTRPMSESEAERVRKYNERAGRVFAWGREVVRIAGRDLARRVGESTEAWKKRVAERRRVAKERRIAEAKKRSAESDMAAFVRDRPRPVSPSDDAEPDDLEIQEV